MHTYRHEDNRWQVGRYTPVTWFNPLFGPRTIDEWKTLKEVETEEEAVTLVARLNGAIQR